MKSFSTILLTQHDKLRVLESAPWFFQFQLTKITQIVFSFFILSISPTPTPLNAHIEQIAFIVIIAAA